MKRYTVVIGLLVILSFALAVIFYPQMPERMASHWDAAGNVNGYTSKFWGLLSLPLMQLLLAALFLVIPKIDPLKDNIEKFRNYFYGFAIIVLAFMLYIFSLIIAWNLGLGFNMTQLMAPAMGILFFCTGFLISKAKRNWFIGIRTPWTLSDEKVWDKTHVLGGKLFKIAGIIAVLGVFFPKYTFLFVIIPVLSVAVFSVIYSYFVYRREHLK